MHKPIQPFIFLAIALLFLGAAFLSSHEESVIDIFFSAADIVAGTICINLFRKQRLEKKLRQY